MLVSGWVCVGVGCLRGEAARAGEWVGRCGGGLSIEWVGSCGYVGWGTAVDQILVHCLLHNYTGQSRDSVLYLLILKLELSSSTKCIVQH